jgi:hypothetical protein
MRAAGLRCTALRRTRQLRALIFANGRGIIMAPPLLMIVIAND